MQTRHRLFVVVAVSWLIVMVVTPTAVARDVTFVVEAVPGDLRFSPDRISVDPGDRVTIRFFNNHSIVHTLDIDEFNVHTGDVQPGQNVTVAFTATQGTFQYYCDISGHRSAGMWGTLTVGQPSTTPIDLTLVLVVAAAAIIVASVATVLLVRRGKKQGGA